MENIYDYMFCNFSSAIYFTALSKSRIYSQNATDRMTGEKGIGYDFEEESCGLIEDL
jgi:hypothetical protein